MRASGPSKQQVPLPVRIGWQGIQLRVPEGWFLKGYTGEWKEGYLQIGSPGSTEIDIKWVRSRRRTDLPYVLRQFLRRIERAKRRIRQPYLGTIKPIDEETLEFRWQSDERALGQIRRYPDCHTIVLIQARSGSRHETLHHLARAIFETLSVKPDPDGWVVWSLYGLCTAVPERFRLAKAQILTGQTRLIFRHRREHLLIERIARAEQLRKGYTFEEWANLWLKWEPYRRSARSKLDSTPEMVPSLRLSARLPLSTAIAETVRSVLTLHRPAWYVEAIAWVAPERNTIFHIHYQTPRKNALLEEVLARTRCP